MSATDPRYVTDWQALFMELRRHGLSVTSIAKELRIPFATLYGYAAQGATPRHPEGETLLEFYRTVTNSERGQEPKKRRPLNGNGRR